MALLQHMKERGSCGGHRKTSEGVTNTAILQYNRIVEGLSDIHPP